MCGIAGFIDFKCNSSESVLIQMRDTLLHRGPDAKGEVFWEKETFQIGLAHRRLAIIDLTESANQPMQYKNYWVTFNGEIYNFSEIKKELISLGHYFSNNSDTEVILHAFDQWGVECTDRFIGMFVFVLYDYQKQEVFCVRDRTGIKPFYYYWHDGLFLFASELKAFHKHPHFVKELDLSAVAMFMQFGNVPTSSCIFKNCSKLSPGHFLKVNILAATFSTLKYWDVYDSYNKPKTKIDFEEAKLETERLMKSAADYRLIADVPVGVFLSGGYDSACLTALLQKDKTQKIKTYTIAVPDIGLNEAPFAKEIADYLGTDHHEYECDVKEALDLINELPYFYDEPFADSSAIPTTLVCKMARKEVTVALSADAGDEVFAGYNRYDYMMNLGSKIKNTPSIVRKPIAGVMNWINADHIPFFNKKHNFKNRYDKLKSLLKEPSDKNLMLSLSTEFNESDLRKLFFKDINVPETRYTNSDLKDTNYSSLSYIMAIDYQTYLVDDILQKVDRASMSVSLEAREPYLDHRLIEWAAQLPDNFKYNRGIKKHILKEITHKHIPKNLMDRPKMGFAIPIEKWLANELKEKLKYYLSKDKLVKQGVFNPDLVTEIVRKFMGGKREFAVKVWYLLMFQMWYEKWMDS